MKLNVGELRRISEEASRLAEEAKRAADEALCGKVLAELPERIKARAAECYRWLEVIKVPSEGYRRRFLSFLFFQVWPKDLAGIYRRIFEYCHEQGLHPWVHNGEFENDISIRVKW